MKENVLRNWNFFRLLRLVIGIVIIVQAIIIKDAMFGVAGILFAAMSVFNVGCCGAGGCAVPLKKSNESTKEITYDEVV